MGPQLEILKKKELKFHFEIFLVESQGFSAFSTSNKTKNFYL